MQAINEFQANPQAAMHKYRDNAAMQAFFRDFCALLGLLTSIYHITRYLKCPSYLYFLYAYYIFTYLFLMMI